MPSEWQICSVPDTVLYSTDLLDRGVSGVVWVSDKLFSHDALPCLRTLVKSSQWKERQRESSREQKQGRVSYSDKGGRERDRQRVMEEMGVTATTGRWREMERDWEVAGLCFCSLTAWQSSLDWGLARQSLRSLPSRVTGDRLLCNSVWQASQSHRGADTDAPFFRRDARHNSSPSPPQVPCLPSPPWLSRLNVTGNSKWNWFCHWWMYIIYSISWC